jgi:outer membrane protein OmpA-like peptidoglycan-associated protein
MSSGLLATLQGFSESEFTRQASATLDEHEFGIARTLDGALAAIVCALERNAADATIIGEVAKLIGDRGNDTSVLSNVSSLLNPVTGAGSIALGERLVNLLFGARTNAIGTAVARASGVGSSSGETMLPLAGSLVLAQLAKKFGSGVPAASAVAGLINGERAALQKTVPTYIRNMIAPVREGGAKALSGTPEVPALSSLAWLVLPLCLLIGLFWVLLSPDTPTYEMRPIDNSSSRSTSDRRESDRDTRAATRPAERESGSTIKPRTTSEWAFDTTPSSSSSSSSSTSSQPQASSSRREPPIEGLVRITLPNSAEIDVVASGLEPKMLDFIGDRWASIDKTKWFDFDRVRFKSGSSDITFGSRAQLRNVATIMKAYPSVAIKIGGYTDNVGDPQANMRLSDARAKRVMEELIRLGVSATRLEAEGYGDQHPVADNTTAEGRAKNRRTAVSVRAK